MYLIGSDIIKTHGRITIYANTTEKELLSGTIEQIKAKIIDILQNSIPIHKQNKMETEYLKDYYRGKQDIYFEKQKLTRPDINNKSVENWAYAFIDFKKTYLLGKPIQYVQLNDAGEEEISKLNEYVRYENKKSKDMDIYEDILICGRGFRYTNNDKVGEEDAAPFELLNCPTELTEVVYSSKLGNEQLLSFIETPMVYIYSEVNPETGEKESIPRYYEEYTVYLRNMSMVFSNKIGKLEFVKGSEKPILINEHIITEYYVHKNRMSLIEIGKDIFNDINYLESLDKDDMEAFVNNLLIFINCEATEQDLQEMASLGAVNIVSTDQKKASIETIQQRLKASDTQIYYNRLINAAHQILGIPMATDNAVLNSGETGKAKLTGQGYTSATIRIEGDETRFGDCDKNCLKVILKICNSSPKSEIKSLKLSHIDSKFQRDVSDNLLVKTQGMMNLLQSNIPKKYALSIPNLFSDVNAVVKDMELEEKERERKQKEIQNNFLNNDESNNNDDGDKTKKVYKANEQNNKLNNTIESDNQEQ